ncbi:PAS domain S-box protein [Candidatus Chlorohelix sp.]|uniref:PAS domain S-box protein n=1 Tax=Candidatus Chlorohelix sp. TaxID=3139201 RepID=UPI0030319F9C
MNKPNKQTTKFRSDNDASIIANAFFALNPDWAISYIARQAEPFFPKEQPQLVGKNIWEEYPDLVETAVFTQFHKAVETGEPLDFAWFHPLLAGWLQFYLIPSPEGLAIYLRTIPNPVAGTQAGQRFAKIFEASPIAMAISTIGDGRYREVNDSVLRLLGCSREEMIGRTSTEMGLWSRESDREKMLRQLQEQGYVRDLEIKIRKPDGEVFDCLASTELMDLDGESHLLTMMNDITKRKQAEEALRESENSFRSVVNNIKEVVFQTDAEGLWSFLNPAWMEVTGFSVEESLGQNFLNYVYPEDRQRNLELFTPLIERKKEYCRHTIRYLTKVGTPRWLEVYARLTLDAHDTVIGTSGTLRDVHEQRLAEEALRESEERYRFLAENSTDTITRLSPERIFEYVSPACQKFIGFTPEELVGHPLLEFVHSDDQAQFLQLRPSWQEQNKEVLITYRQRCKNGQYLWVEVSMHYITDPTTGELLNIISVTRDITERRKMEEALAQVRDEALEANRLKSEFLATMSHEIRTPMNSIIGVTELLLETPLEEEQREFAEIIQDSAQNLLTIINDILDYSKIEAGKLVLEEIPLPTLELVENAAETLAPLARKKNLSLLTFVDPNVPERVIGDPVRLRQILLNLISNAIKFTSQGEILVKVRAESIDNSTALLHFSISDTGIGISETESLRLFQSFSQADGSTTRKYGGTGLGLAICKRLVEHMGGEIGVESAPGKGSIFWFSARFKFDATSSVKLLVPELDLSGSLVLVVDDLPSHQQIIRQYLESCGIQSQGAVSGQEALTLLQEAVSKKPFDLAIVDLVLPDIDGFALARAIQKNPALENLPLIMLTAFDERGQTEQALRAEFSAYLTKPLKKAQLLETIERALSERKVRLLEEGKAGRRRIQTQPLKSGIVVLVAEDHPLNQHLIKTQLTKLGYACRIVWNGQETLEAFAKGGYSLILMDCQMPVMDGYTATAHIRRLEKAGMGRIPIVALTANAMPEERKRCLDAGMDEYLSKPVKLETLRQTLENWLPKKGK